MTCKLDLQTEGHRQNVLPQNLVIILSFLLITSHTFLPVATIMQKRLSWLYYTNAKLGNIFWSCYQMSKLKHVYRSLHLLSWWLIIKSLSELSLRTKYQCKIVTNDWSLRALSEWSFENDHFLEFVYEEFFLVPPEEFVWVVDFFHNFFLLVSNLIRGLV